MFFLVYLKVEWIDHSFSTRDEFESFRRELKSNGTVFIKATSRYKQAVGWAVYRCNREGNKVQLLVLMMRAINVIIMIIIFSKKMLLPSII